MADVLWSRPSHATSKLFFVKCPPNKVVYMLDSPQDFHCLRLHYLEEEHSSYPCLGDKCRHCGEREARDYAYTCCLVFGSKAGRWYQAILPIGDPTHTLATTDFRHTIIEVGKPKNPDDGKRLVYYGTKKTWPVPLPHVTPSFDVRPFILRRYGLFKEADLVGCDLHVPSAAQVEQERQRQALDNQVG